MKENYPIDFVITWVDGNDAEWQNEFRKYYKNDKGTDASFSRVRDWDNLQYLFRGIERFSPWVRKVHFVTWGHLPKWLNTKAEKLNIVKHADFIPKEYLPTFSGFPSALNLHRINGIAEHFVVFDDDMFLGRTVAKERFFKNGLPVDFAQLTPVPPIIPFGHYILNSIAIIHKRHKFLSQIKKNFGKWFCPNYGPAANAKNLSLLAWANHVSFKNPHIPVPFLRSTFEQLWNEEFDALNSTCQSKFRNHSDVLLWIMRYEQLASGNFSPHSIKDTHTDWITDAHAAEIADYIEKQKYRLFCINDNNDIADFEKCKSIIKAAFEKILPDKSEFEL